MLKLSEPPAPGEPPVYTDPSRKTFDLAGMKYGRLRTFSPAAAGQTVRALKAGFRQIKTMGDPWQQGGAVILKPSGEVTWAYSSDNPGDRIPLDELVLALKGKSN